MKIVGQLVCGPGEADKYLRETLEEFKRLCDDVIVALCNAGEKEKALVREYDFRSYEDNREWGKFQPYIKTDLVRRIHMLEPDYIVVLDADETMPTMTRAKLETYAKTHEAMQFYVVNLWNDPEHYSRTLSFWNVRAYRSDPDKGVQFLKKPVHCGNAPPYFYSLPAKFTYVPEILLHKGLMDPESRARKSTRYAQYDPQAIHKGREYYDSLELRGTGTLYEQAAVAAKLLNYCKTL